jgi:hypothetical protein
VRPPSYNSMNIYNLGTFDAEGAKALIYGIGKGLAY